MFDAIKKKDRLLITLGIVLVITLILQERTILPVGYVATDAFEETVTQNELSEEKTGIQPDENVDAPEFDIVKMAPLTHSTPGITLASKEEENKLMSLAQFVQDFDAPQQTEPPHSGFRACNAIDLVTPFTQQLSGTGFGIATAITRPGILWPNGQKYIASSFEYLNLPQQTNRGIVEAFGYASGRRTVQVTFPAIALRLHGTVAAYAHRVAYFLRESEFSTYNTPNYLFIREPGPGFFGEGNEPLRLVFAPIGQFTIGSGTLGTPDVSAYGAIYPIRSTVPPYSEYLAYQDFGPDAIPQAIQLPGSDDTIEIVNLRFPSGSYSPLRAHVSDSKIVAYLDITNWRVLLFGPGSDRQFGVGVDEFQRVGGILPGYNSVDVSLADDASALGVVEVIWVPTGAYAAYYADLRLINAPNGYLTGQPTMVRIPLLQSTPSTPTIHAIRVSGQWSSQQIAGSMVVLYSTTSPGGQQTYYFDFRHTGTDTTYEFGGGGNDFTKTVAVNLPSPGDTIYTTPWSLSIDEGTVSFGARLNNQLGVYKIEFC